MDRHEEYRGLREDGQGWVGGFLREYHDGLITIFWGDQEYRVDHSSIGQSIGLKDSNGMWAFTGDIFEDNRGVRRQIMAAPGGFVFESNPVSFGYGLQNGMNPTDSLADQQTAAWFSDCCRIIGNIYDNPELLCSTVK